MTSSDKTHRNVVQSGPGSECPIHSEPVSCRRIGLCTISPNSYTYAQNGTEEMGLMVLWPLSEPDGWACLWFVSMQLVAYMSVSHRSVRDANHEHYNVVFSLFLLKVNVVVVSFYIIQALFKLWPQALRNLQTFKGDRWRKAQRILPLRCSASN